MPAGGKTTPHALGLLEPRGVLFTATQQEVYHGMIIGECTRDGEMEVSNCAKCEMHVAIVFNSCKCAASASKCVTSPSKYACQD